jgi:hypothetical protein
MITRRSNELPFHPDVGVGTTPTMQALTRRVTVTASAEVTLS